MRRTTMKKVSIITGLFFLVGLLSLQAQIPKKELLQRITIPAQKDLRGLVDLVGFPHTWDQMDEAARLLEDAEKDALLKNQKKYSFSENTPFAAGICPHDDYFFAGRGYTQVLRHIKAPRVVIFGVCHWAKTFGAENQFVFDDFKWWRGPYGKVPISPLREDIIRRLKPEDRMVSREIQSVEHSIEALVPFLQYFNRSVEIVPILVPYMKWERMDELAGRMASTLKNIMQEKHWTLGKDLALLISTDCVHYGDYGWSYYNYCPFGVDADGYKKGVKQDLSLVRNHLAGKLESRRIRDFYWKCVDRKDPYTYRITWCGRFSVPAGLDVLFHLVNDLKLKPIKGMLLRYGTSLSFPALPFRKLGLGTTYDSNLHHWVGWTSIGYMEKK